MPTRSKSSNQNSNAAEIARIEALIEDLEKRMHRLNGSAHSEAVGASQDINRFVSDALEGIMERVRERADSMADNVTERAAKAGAEGFRRVVEEAEHYPLATLAVAAGIGFLLGSARR
jgi:ElaB/YqjD/DUF883 family membrane-anchored ribosome-binding protein